MEKYENENGQIGVIVSSGFGAGWSTWNDHQSFLCMDKTLVEMKLNGASSEDAEKYAESQTGDSIYCGGWSDASVEWLDKGTAFTIEEYDGSESLRLLNDLTLVA